MSSLRAILARLRRNPGDSGQAMIEACILIPVLLSLFLGLWHHALLGHAQTRSLLAARHAASPSHPSCCWVGAAMVANGSVSSGEAR